MVGASDEVELVALMRAQKRAAIATTRAPDQSRHRALNECDFVTRISRTERDQIVRTKWRRLSTRSAAQFTAFVDKAARSSTPKPTLTAMARSTPPDARGHFQRAHRGRTPCFLL